MSHESTSAETVTSGASSSSQAPSSPAPSSGGGGSASAGARRVQLKGMSFADGARSLEPGDQGAGSGDVAQRGLSGPGAPVGGGHAARFQAATGRDVAGATEHTGPEASEACQALGGIEAFALGDSVAYRDESPRDEVRYHELAHVAQGTAPGGEAQAFGGAGSAKTDTETNADDVAAAVLNGGKASVASPLDGDAGLAFFDGGGKGNKKQATFGTGDLKVEGKGEDDYEQAESAEEVVVTDQGELAEIERVSQLAQGGKVKEAYDELAGVGDKPLAANVVKALDQRGIVDVVLNALDFQTLFASGNREATRTIFRGCLPENNVRRALNLVTRKVKVSEDGKADYKAKKDKKGGGDDEAYAAYQIVKCLPPAEQKLFMSGGTYGALYTDLILGYLNKSQIDSDDLNMYGGGADKEGKRGDEDKQSLLKQLDDPALWAATDEIGVAQLENVMRMCLVAGQRPAVVLAAEKYKGKDLHPDLMKSVLGEAPSDDGMKDMTKKEKKQAAKGDSRGLVVEGIDVLSGGEKGGHSGHIGRVGEKGDKRKDGYEVKGLELDEVQDVSGQENGIKGVKFSQAGLDDKKQEKNGDVAGKDYIEDDDVNRIDAVISWDKGLLFVQAPTGLALDFVNMPSDDMTLKSGPIRTGKLTFSATFPPKATSEARDKKDYEGTKAASMKLEIASAEIHNLMFVFPDSIITINSITLKNLVIESESAPGTLKDLESADDAASTIMASESIGSGLTGLSRLLKPLTGGQGTSDLASGIGANALTGDGGGGSRISVGDLEVIGISTSGGTQIGKITAKNLDLVVKRLPSEILPTRRAGLAKSAERQVTREQDTKQQLAALDTQMQTLGDDRVADKEKLAAQKDGLEKSLAAIGKTKTDIDTELALVDSLFKQAPVLDKYCGPNAKPPEGEAPAIVEQYHQYIKTNGGVGMLDADQLSVSGMTLGGGKNLGTVEMQGVSAMGSGASISSLVSAQTESLAGPRTEGPETGKYSQDDQLHARVDQVSIKGGNVAPETTVNDVSVSLDDADAVPDAEGKTDTNSPTKKLELHAGTVTTDVGGVTGVDTEPVTANGIDLSVTSSGNVLNSGGAAFYGKPMRIGVSLAAVNAGATRLAFGTKQFSAGGAGIQGLSAEVDVQLDKTGEGKDEKTKLSYGKIHSLRLPKISAQALHLELPIEGQTAVIDVPSASIEGLFANEIPLTNFSPWDFEGSAGFEKIQVEAQAGLGDAFKAGAKLDVGAMSLGVFGDQVKFDLDGLKLSDVYVDQTGQAPAGSFADMITKLGGRINKIGDVGVHVSYDKVTGAAGFGVNLAAIDISNVNVAAAGMTLGAKSAFLGPVDLAARVELDSERIKELVAPTKKKEGEETPDAVVSPYDLIKKVYVDSFGIGKLEGTGLDFKGGGNDVHLDRGYFEELTIKGVVFDPKSDKSILPFLTDFDANLKKIGIEGFVGQFQTGKGPEGIVKASLTTHASGMSIKRANNGKTTFNLKDFDVNQASLNVGGGDIDMAAVLKNFGAGFTLTEGGIGGRITLASLVMPHAHYDGMDPKTGVVTDVDGGPASLTDVKVDINVGLAKSQKKNAKTGKMEDKVEIGAVTMKSIHVGRTGLENFEVITYKPSELLLLGFQLAKAYGLTLTDAEAEHWARVLAIETSTKHIKSAIFNSMDLTDVKIGVPGEALVQSKSFDLKGLDVDVRNGGLTNDLGEFLKLGGDIHAGKFSYDNAEGGTQIDLNNFDASGLIARYQGHGGAMTSLQASNVNVDLKGKNSKENSTITVTNGDAQLDADDEHLASVTTGGAKGTAGKWPEYEQKWSFPLLDKLNGNLAISIPFGATMLDLPVVIVDGQVQVVPAFVAKAMQPQRYAIADEIATENLLEAMKHDPEGALSGRSMLGAMLIEDMLAPLVVNLLNYFKPDALNVRSLVESNMNTKYGFIPGKPATVSMEKSLQEMLDETVAGMGGWAILIDYLAPKGQGVFVSSAVAVWDWCASWFRSDEKNKEVEMQKVQRRARVLADVVSDLQVGPGSFLQALGGDVSATRAPVSPGTTADGKPTSDHVIGKHETFFNGNADMTMALAGSLGTGLSMGTDMKVNSFKGNFHTFEMEGSGIHANASGTTKVNQGKDDGIESADVTNAEGGVHVDYAKITLLNEVEIAKQKTDDQANITQAGGDQSGMLMIESQMFTKFIGRPPKSYEERLSFRKFTADHGVVSPLEKVTNEGTK